MISLQCSIVRHLSAKQTSSSPCDSSQAPKTDDKDPSSVNLHPSHSTDGTASAKTPECLSLNSEEHRVCSSCTEKPCQNCSTSNGPVERPAHANGKLKQACPADPEASNTPRSPAPPMLTLRNHSGPALIKTEDLKSCAATESLPSVCVKSETAPPPPPPHTQRASPRLPSSHLPDNGASCQVSSVPSSGESQNCMRSTDSLCNSRNLFNPVLSPTDGKICDTDATQTQGNGSSLLNLGDLSSCLRSMIKGSGGEHNV